MTTPGYRQIAFSRTAAGQCGFVLMPVILLITVLAAVIFLLTRENSSSMTIGSREAQVMTASLVAEAGLRHATWKASTAGTCTNYVDLVDVPFGEHLYSATYSNTSGSPIAITASGVLAGGAMHSVTKAQTRIFESPNIRVLQPGPDGIDTYVWDGAHKDTNFGATALMSISSSGAERVALLRFDLSTIPEFARISSAVLELYLEGGNGLTDGVIDAHRISQPWYEGAEDDDPPGTPGATYMDYDGANAWASPGGDFDPTPVTTTVIPDLSQGWYRWDLTGLAKGGPQSDLAINGVLLRASGGIVNNIRFTSSDGNAAGRPRLLVSYACECGAGKAGSIVLQPASSGLDTSLRNLGGSESTTNYGNDSELRVSTNGGRSLLKFDLSAIPAVAIVESAELEMNFKTADALSSATFGVHEATRDWRETEATWNEYQAGETWATPGGDHNPAAVDTTTITSSPNASYAWDVTSLAADWVSGTTINNGLLLRVSSGGGSVTNARFVSSDASTAANRPKLTVNYRCPCGVDCDPTSQSGGFCEADYVANAKTFSFDWGPATNDVTGVDFLPEGTLIDGVTIPSGGGWIMTDRNEDKIFVVDEAGAALTDFAIDIADPHGIAYIESGTWTGHLAVADLSNDTIHFVDLDGAIVASFLTDGFTDHPFGLSFIGDSGTHVYDDHLAISSDDGAGTVYIVDQSGVLKAAIDVESYAPKPQGIAHLAGNDKFMVADKTGLISIIDFTGTVLNQYDAVAWGLDQLQGLTIHPGTCDHVMINRSNSIAAGLNLRETPGGGTPRLLFVVADTTGLSDQELTKKSLFEYWGYKVTVIDDNASAGNYDAAVPVNDVAFVGEDISASNLGSKLTDATIGVVYEEVFLSDKFGMSSSINWSSGSDIDIDDTSHHITQGFALGPLNILTTSGDLAYLAGTLAPDLRQLGSTAAGPMLATLEAGGTLFNTLPAAGRRVQLPWGESNFNMANLSSDAETLLKNSLQWGAQPPPRCDADFAANHLVSDFPWMTGTGDIHGIDYLRAGLFVNSVPIPAGGGWVMSDKGKDRLFVTDLAGNALTDFPVIPEKSQGVALIEAGNWIHHLAVAGVDSHGEARLYYLNLEGGIEWSFLLEDIVTNPLGLDYIGETASGLYDNYLAISSDKSPSGGGTATIYIIGQSGELARTIDIEAYAPTPQGISHLTGSDKFLITDKNGLVSIIDFDGNLLRQYWATDFGLTELNDVAINPMTCEHVIVDKDFKKVGTADRDTGSGTGPDYIEMNIPWSAVAEDSWEVVNLGIYGVAANAVVEVAVINNDGGKELWGGVRAMGSTLDRRLQLHEAGGGGADIMVLHVQADAAARIEHYSEDPDKLGFKLLGYWTESAYVENWQSFKAGGNSSWRSHALNAYGVAGGDIAEIVMVNTNGFADLDAGVRPDGSGLNRRFTLHEAQDGGVESMAILTRAGTDAGATVELYAENDADISFYLAGYWSTPPGDYTEAIEDLGTASVNETWLDSDLGSDGVPANAIAHIALVNRQFDKEGSLGVRARDSLPMRILELHQSLNGGEDLATMHVRTDASSTIEWFDQDILMNHTFYLLGWWELP